MSEKNPKLVDSNIIDCIPQTGECPNKCSECFYNGRRFYRTLDKPLIPTLEEVGDKIVRVNSGHDSNLEKERVKAVTSCYKNRFYNTSIPNFEFPAPVVFTADRQCPQNKVHLVAPTPNLMFVRARVTPWNLDEVQKIIDHYWKKHRIPVVLTFMRFYNGGLIPQAEKHAFVWTEHITNSYWCLKTEQVVAIMSFFKGQGARMCGTPYSSLCVDCRNCEFLYRECMRKLDALKER